MAWPQSDEVEAAIQYPGLSFRDPELRGGVMALDSHGLPKVASGNSAYVYELRKGGQCWAVRVFSRAVTDQAWRYALIASYLAPLGSPYFVECVYMADELLVQGARYPIVKMQWVEGVTLTTWVKRHCRQPDQVRELARKWEAMLRELGRHPMAHGDLQHDNVLVTPGGELKLIDYDGMYVPAMQGERGPERGHPNWNHPGRTAATFGPYLDQFPGLVGYLSLLAIAADPGLLRYCTDENLILRQGDYRDSARSAVLGELRWSPDTEVRRLADLLVEWCEKPIDALSLGDALVSPIPGPAPQPAPRPTKQPPKPPGLVIRPASQPPSSRKWLAVRTSVAALLLVLLVGTVVHRIGRQPPLGENGVRPTAAVAPPSLGPDVGDHSQVLALLARLRTQPDQDEVWGLLGRAYARQGSGQLADGFYAVALLLDPEDWEWRSKAPNLENAVLALARADIRDDEWIGKLADKAMMRGAADAAQALYSLALKLDPEDQEWVQKLSISKSASRASPRHR